MSKMVTRNLQRQLDQIGDKKKHEEAKMQENVQSRKVISIFNSDHHVSLVISRIDEKLVRYMISFIRREEQWDA
jgi:hypothetical protein